MKISTGGLEVMYSGMVHSKGKESVDFILSDSMILSVAILEEEDAKPVIDLIPEGNKLVIRFTNPQSQLHFGPRDPIQVGTYEGRDFFVQLRINVYGGLTSYSVDYTFYKGAKSGGL